MDVSENVILVYFLSLDLCSYQALVQLPSPPDKGLSLMCSVAEDLQLYSSLEGEIELVPGLGFGSFVDRFVPELDLELPVERVVPEFAGKDVLPLYQTASAEGDMLSAYHIASADWDLLSQIPIPRAIVLPTALYTKESLARFPILLVVGLLHQAIQGLGSQTLANSVQVPPLMGFRQSVPKVGVLMDFQVSSREVEVASLNMVFRVLQRMLCPLR